jgi:hypothetical protein
MIRQKISQAEVDLYFDILAGLDWHPMFLVLVFVDDGDQAIERARATLISLCRQGYPDWHREFGRCDDGSPSQDRKKCW